MTTVELCELPGPALSPLGACVNLKHLKMTHCGLIALDSLSQCKHLQCIDVQVQPVSFSNNLQCIDVQISCLSQTPAVY